MRQIPAFWIAAAFLLMNCSAPAIAQSMLRPLTQNGVTFVSGGVAEDSQQAMLAVRGDYNLHLLFAQAVTGEYFAMVPLRIYSSSGATLVSATSEGPFFYARLTPGRYTVEAIHNGAWMKETATIRAKGAVDLYFYWPAS